MKWTCACIAVAAILLAAGAARAAGVEDDYLKAKACYGELKVDTAKARNHGAWRRCIGLFENVAKKYPKTERAPQALFNVGKLNAEAWGKFHQRDDVDAAIKAFNQLIRDYPKDSLADDALYQIGRLRHSPLKEDDRARTAFSYIAENYPDGDMAEKAKAELKALDGGERVAEGGAASPEKVVSKKGDPLEQEVVGVKGAAAGKGAAPEKGAGVAAGAAAGAAPPEAAEKPAVAAGKPKAAGAFEAPAAGPKSPATLDTITVEHDDAETAVTLLLTRRAAYSVEFTDTGARTKAPPKLDMLLTYTKPGAGLEKEIAVSSPHLARIKVKKGIKGVLEGDIHVIFEMQPDTSYAISSKGEQIVVRFRPGSAKAAPAPLPARAGQQRAAAERPGKPLVVVIDPGHGGQESGAVGKNGTQEKDVTLALARRLAARLSELPDVKPFLTRTDDRTLSLEERNAVAVAKRADLFLSIHANASTDRKMSGIETYYLNNASDEAAERLARRENRSAKKKMSDVEHILSTMLQNYDAAESQLLASDVQASLMERMAKRYSGVKNRRVRSALFYVLVGAKCPAILVESSFISNPREEERLKESGYQNDLAASMVSGIRAYIKAGDKRVVSL